MTDWDRIVEEIQRAMGSLDKVNEAREALRKEVTPENVDAFKEQMRELRKNLCEADYIFKHEFDFSVGEIIDMYTRIRGENIPHRESHHFRGTIAEKETITKP